MGVWSGWGILVPVFNLVAFLMSAMLISILNLTSDMSFAVAVGLCGMLAGAAIYITARAIEEQEGGVIDETAPQRVLKAPCAGAFLWIPTRLWSVINPAAGLVLAVLTLLSPGGAGA